MADEIKFTAENLANQCLGIRVDFLDEDELDHELFMRNMFLTGEQTMSRRRRALREALKQEKEEGVSVKHLPNSVENELAICEAKLHRLEASSFTAHRIAPKCKSTLLHLGQRLLVLIQFSGGNYQDSARDLLLRVISHLNHFYGGEDSISSSDENQNREEVDLTGQDTRIDQEIEQEEAIGPLPPSNEAGSLSSPIISLGQSLDNSPQARTVELELLNFFQALRIIRQLGNRYRFD